VVERIISHYRIVEKIGEGGMGEVYLAEDISLPRQVALKFLPEIVQQDEIARKRLLREACSAAALDHPYLCNVFEVAQTDDGRDFIAMEYLEGETLQDCLAKGPLPLRETLKLGAELAEAIEAAHRKGIVHRDLKPANIMITPAGHAKIMDFGLAKKVVAEDGREQEISLELTREGSTLGTLSYMSPEQIRGERLDARSDIFSLGILLYEAVTGVHPFRRVQSAETTSAILREDPPPATRYLDDLPELLGHTLHKMLEKDPEERYQSVHEVLTNLNRLREDSGKVRMVETQQAPRIPSWVWIAMVALCTLTAALTWSLIPTGDASPGPAIRTSIVFPENIQLAGGLFPGRREILLSPDGKMVLFSGSQGDNPQTTSLYGRRLDSDQILPIPGTEGARQPFLSPDGQWIGFWASGKLKKVRIEGGIPIDLAEVETIPPGACWLESGKIVLGSCLHGLDWLSEEGGSLHSLTEVDDARETRHLQPWPLPGGSRLLFTTVPHNWGTQARIEALDLPSGSRHPILEDAADGRYLPTGHLIFVRRGQLMAVPFDPERLKLTGTPVPVLDRVQQALNIGNTWANSTSGQFYVSDSGVLVYAAGGIFRDPPFELVWVDRSGKVETVEGLNKPLVCWPSLSPDQARVAFCEKAISGGLWLFDLARHTHESLLPAGISGCPVWSPDGTQLAFAWSAAGPFDVWVLSVHRKEGRRRLTHGTTNQFPSSWSPDGKHLAIVENSDILIYDFDSERLRPFFNNRSERKYASFSPDGRWLAYCSAETGLSEVYVTSFPDRTQTLMISNQGGYAPVWAPSGKELFYVGPGGASFLQVDIRLGARISAGVPHRLFDLQALGGLVAQSPVTDISVDRGGERFLFPRPKPLDPGTVDNRPEPITRLDLVTNWFEELRVRVPVE